MAKKKRSAKAVSSKNNPFRALKGFAVSEPDPPPPAAPEPPVAEAERSFAAEMDFLGVAPMEPQESESVSPDCGADEELSPAAEPLSDEELFLGALGDFEVRFRDQQPAREPAAQPRRLKQLKQGRIRPDASLDLHGLLRNQVVAKIEHFLQNARHQQWQTLLIVTGRGLHSPGGEPVLRDEAERYLAAEGRRQVAEWSRAPRQYGGEGALVVFMKKREMENEE